MLPHECLSIMELQDIKENGAGVYADHLLACARCSTLLEQIPALQFDSVETYVATPHLSATQRIQPQTVEVRPGGFWVADDGEGSDWRMIVAVIGRSRRDPRLVVVAPVSTEIDDSTDLDLRVDDESLGYPAQLAVWNHGWIYDDQLRSPIGELDDSKREEMMELYRWLLRGGARPSLTGTTAPEIAYADDRRNLRRELEREQMQALGRRVSNDQEPLEEENPERLVAAGSPVVSFGSIVRAALETAEWDAVTLSDVAAVERIELERILADQLDLTWAKDARTVVQLIRALDQNIAEIETPLRASLALSEGGEPVGDSWFRAAARSRSGSSDEDTLPDLLTGDVDLSNEARERQAESYWQRVLDLYDSFS